jgi:hypothetical protein
MLELVIGYPPAMQITNVNVRDRRDTQLVPFWPPVQKSADDGWIKLDGAPIPFHRGFSGP